MNCHIIAYSIRHFVDPCKGGRSLVTYHPGYFPAGLHILSSGAAVHIQAIRLCQNECVISL